MNAPKKETLKIVLSEGLTGAALTKFNQVNDLSVQYANTVKLLNHKFIGGNALLVQQSGLVNAVHSAKFIHGLTAYNLSGWIFSVIEGKDTPCPIDPTKGIFSHPVVRFFRDNQASIASSKAARRQAAEDKKAAKEAEEQAKNLARQKATGNVEPTEQAKTDEQAPTEQAKTDEQKRQDFTAFCDDLERISAIEEGQKINAVLNMIKSLSPEGRATIAVELAAMQAEQAEQAQKVG